MIQNRIFEQVSQKELESQRTKNRGFRKVELHESLHDAYVNFLLLSTINFSFDLFFCNTFQLTISDNER